MPNGSRDIPFQSQEFGQDGHRHFVSFQPHFHLNMTSQTQCCMTMKKMKAQYLSSLLFVLFETLQPFRTQQRILAWFQISLLWQLKSKLLSVIEKTKALLFKQEWCSKSSLKQYSWLLLQVVSSFEEKLVIYSSCCEKTIVFCFWTKGNYSRLSCHSNEI